MGGGAFILLKTGRSGPESTKQAEIRLAGLPKLLNISAPGTKIRSQRADSTCNGCTAADFREVWLIGHGGARLVIQITVLAVKMAQYPAMECRNKSIQVSISDSIQDITFICQVYTC